MGYKDKTKQSEYQKQWMQKRREEFIKKLGPCIFCGATENLQIHHVDPSVKIHHAIWSWRRDRIKAELQKCVALCEHCHTTFHSILKQKPLVHGTTSGYYMGCRCKECVEARRAYYWEHEAEDNRKRKREKRAREKEANA